MDSAVRITWSAPRDSSVADRGSELIEELCNFRSVVDEGANKNGQTGLSWIAARATVRSALFLVLDLFSCPEKLSGQPGYVIGSGAKGAQELKLQQQAMVLTQETAEDMYSLATQLIIFAETESTDGSLQRQLSRVSPYLLDVMYCSLATYHWFAGEQGNETYQSKIGDMELLFDKLGTRWNLGCEYLSLSRYHDSRARSNLLSEAGR